MFDVRTSKRTYYLVAKSDAEMNKWVECICSVCGLKIHVDENAETTDYRYSPQPSQELSCSVPSNGSSSGSSFVAASQAGVEGVGASAKISAENKSSVLTEQQSNPYIPISECHTGKPINGIIAPHNFSELSDKPTRLDESYDIPRVLRECGSNAQTDLLYQVPVAPTNYRKLEANKNSPPKVNWSTYPKDSPLTNPIAQEELTRASVRSCKAAVDVTKLSSAQNLSSNAQLSSPCETAKDYANSESVGSLVAPVSLTQTYNYFYFYSIFSRRDHQSHQVFANLNRNLKVVLLCQMFLHFFTMFLPLPLNIVEKGVMSPHLLINHLTNLRKEKNFLRPDLTTCMTFRALG